MIKIGSPLAEAVLPRMFRSSFWVSLLALLMEASMLLKATSALASSSRASAIALVSTAFVDAVFIASKLEITIFTAASRPQEDNKPRKAHQACHTSFIMSLPSSDLLYTKAKR